MDVRQLPNARALAVALATLVIAGSCTAVPAPPPTRRPPAAFVIPTDLPNGRVELTIAPSYPIGAPLVVPIALVARSGTISGPLTARVMASGINESGHPAETLVRDLAATPVTISNGRGSATVTWDTRDQRGVLVPADSYSLVLEFRSGDGARATIASATASLDLR